MDDFSAKQVPNTPREILRQAVRDRVVEPGQLALWLDVSERWVDYLLKEGRGHIRPEQLEHVRLNLRRRGLNALALELARAELPDYDVSHSARPSFDECDHDQSGCIGDADLRHHATQACERLIACLKGDCADPHDVAALADAADMHVTRLIHSARLQIARGPKETRRDTGAALRMARA